MLTDLEVRAAFHCTLLQRPVSKVPDGVCLKGGVNLRLFFGSERYSEDIDFDADPRHNANMPRILDEIVGDAGFRCGCCDRQSMHDGRTSAAGGFPHTW